MVTKINTQYGHYTVDKNNQFHSENDEPAIIQASHTKYGEDNIETFIDGFKAWYNHGKIHREEGPAVIRDCGVILFYLNGQLIREEM